MSELFQLIPEDGRAYRLTREQLVAAYRYLQSCPKSGVPRVEVRERREEVLAFRDKLKQLSHLVQWNRQELGADDPLPHQREFSGEWAWYHTCWPEPTVALDLAREARKLAEVLSDNAPQVEEESYERFECKREHTVRLLVIGQLTKLDYLFHGRTLDDLDHDQRALAQLPVPIYRWIVATPGSREHPQGEELLWLAEPAVLAGPGLFGWPPEWLDDLQMIWTMFELLKHRFGQWPVFSIGHWQRGGAQALRDQVRSQPLLRELADQFLEQWFPDVMVRVPAPEPEQIKEFLSDPRVVRQSLRFEQSHPHLWLPLIRRSWIETLESRAEALERRIEGAVPADVLKAATTNASPTEQQLPLEANVAAGATAAVGPLATRVALDPRFQLAQQSYVYALARLPIPSDQPPTTQDVYDWLKENGFEEYKLPAFATWERYLREATRYEQNRANPQAEGKSDRSLVRFNEL
jgi:hypothetical protein